MRNTDKLWSLSVAGGALGAVATVMLAAPAAHADPEIPVPPPPLPLPAEQAIATQPAPGDPVLAAAPDPALAAPADPALAAPVDPALAQTPPAPVQHLSSPENLPPGTSDVPVGPPQGRGTSYLRDLFHAYQTQEIDGKGALLLLTQRPLDPNAMPSNGMPTAPQAPPGTPLPLGPGPDAAPADAPPADAAAPAPGPAPLLPGLPGLPPPAATP